ncbi:MAG: sulfotransferase [Candidatus Anammoximicrobium sp.]|mgnify:FL=1|nr:sulfotransferase [Candidatus Anammoximicrobium sp.]
MDVEIIVVSGLPRSGTSLMMQMLASGGVLVVTDRLRPPDADNPRGYYEFEKVKTIKQDSSWLPEIRGKALKVVSQLLYDLPLGERYRIIFMERDLDEILASQEQMLARLGRTSPPREELRRSYRLHLERLHEWLGRQPHVQVLRVSYNQLLRQPAREADRVCEFLGAAPDADAMAACVDPSLHRNRSNVPPTAISTGDRN